MLKGDCQRGYSLDGGEIKTQVPEQASPVSRPASTSLEASVALLEAESLRAGYRDNSNKQGARKEQSEKRRKEQYRNCLLYTSRCV